MLVACLFLNNRSRLQLLLPVVVVAAAAAVASSKDAAAHYPTLPALTDDGRSQLRRAPASPIDACWNWPPPLLLWHRRQKQQEQEQQLQAACANKLSHTRGRKCQQTLLLLASFEPLLLLLLLLFARSRGPCSVSVSVCVGVRRPTMCMRAIGARARAPPAFVRRRVCLRVRRHAVSRVLNGSPERTRLSHTLLGSQHHFLEQRTSIQFNCCACACAHCTTTTTTATTVDAGSSLMPELASAPLSHASLGQCC